MRTAIPTSYLPAILADVDLSDVDALEERCREYLTSLRWPAGAECPRCEETQRLLWLESRSKWQCYSCRYQFSVTAQTLFHNSHLPLWKWFVAVHLLVETPEGISASRLRQVLGCSYKTAWFAGHRIRAAMRGRGEELLRGVVEAETGHAPAYGRRRFAGPYHHLSAKYLTAYLDERRWRTAHRGNAHVFRDTIIALLRSEGLSYEQLVAVR
jgi:transposase-like protein